MRPRFAFFGLAVFFTGCNALLGIESGEFVEPPAASPDGATEGGLDATSDAPGDARSDGTIPPSEGGIADAKPDVVEAGATDADAAAPDANDAGPDADADAGGGCGDLQTDPHSCGTCGHDCLGGACSLGACQPYVLADLGTNDLRALALGATDVFWTNATTNQLQTTKKTSVNGAAETVVTIAPHTFADEISCAGAHVYFGEIVTDGKHRVARALQTDRAAGSETIADNLAQPINVVAADATRTVWNELLPAGSVFRCTTVPCSAPLDVVGTDSFPQNLAVGNGRIAWSSLTSKDIKVAVGAGTGTKIGAGANSISAIVLLADTLVYADRGIGVVAIDLLTNTPRPPMATDGNIEFISADPDGTTIWYLNVTTFASKLVHVNSTSGAPVTATTVLKSPRALAVDDKRVYWLDTVNNQNRVMGLAK